ncbi:MAG: hypothetical protein ACRYFX_21565 [Janthinobacterium lividum]
MFYLARCPWLILTALLLLLTNRPAAAQLLPAAVPARTSDFMTLTVLESPLKNMAKLLLTPAFNGRSEIQLEDAVVLASTRLEHLCHNNEVLSQSLGELSAAGWELAEVHSVPFAGDKDILPTRYLLRRPRP